MPDFQKDQAIETTDDNLDIKVVIAWVATLGLGIIGALLGGCVGYLAGAGVATLIGAGVGFLFMFLIGFLALGPAKKIIDDAYTNYAPPDATRTAVLGLTKEFSLHVTVHNLRNTVNTEGILAFFGKQNDSFVQIRCGRQMDEDSDFLPGKNPPKRTCVSHNNTFEETFNFLVAPTENTLLVDLYDQDMIGDDLVGTAKIDISQDVLAGGFPQKMGFKLQREEGLLFGKTLKKTGTVILSFYPGDGFPQKVKDRIKTKAPLEWKRLEDTQKQIYTESLAKYTKTSYGSIVRDGTLMTKTTMLYNEHSEAAHHAGTAGTGSATQLEQP